MGGAVCPFFSYFTAQIEIDPRVFREGEYSPFAHSYFVYTASWVLMDS